MRFTQCGIPGARIVDPSPHADERGRFFRAWCIEEFAGQDIEFVPLQANMGSSGRAGTMRGLHYQVAPHEEAKLVRCTRGRVFDVLVDLRPDSPAYGRWFGLELSAENARMLYVPPLCAHGYETLEDESEVLYMTSAIYAPAAVRGVRYNDPAISVEWPMPIESVSQQDLSWPLLGPEHLRVAP